MNALRLSWLLALGLVAIPACLDFTPNSPAVLPPDADSGTVPDDAGATTARSASAHVDCLTCAEASSDGGAGCGDVYATCEGSAKCLAMFECGMAKGCFVPGVVAPTCLTPCGEKAGILASTDPAIMPFTALYTCVAIQCSAACAN